MGIVILFNRSFPFFKPGYRSSVAAIALRRSQQAWSAILWCFPACLSSLPWQSRQEKLKKNGWFYYSLTSSILLLANWVSHIQLSNKVEFNLPLCLFCSKDPSDAANNEQINFRCPHFPSLWITLNLIV